MKKLYSFLILALLAVATVQAQRVRFELSFEPAVQDELKVYVLPLAVDGVERAIQLRGKEDKYVGGIPVSGKGLYDIVVVYDNRQLMSTVHVVPDKENKARLSFVMQGYMLMLDDTPENRALSELNMVMNDLDRALWTRQGLGSDSLRMLVEGFGLATESLNRKYRISRPVVDYMKVWAFTRAYNAYMSIPRAQNIKASAVGFDVADVLPDMTAALDNEYAPLFPIAAQMIARSIPAERNLLERLSFLYDRYKNDAVRAETSSMLLSSFLSGHNYSADFEGGLAQLEQAVEKYDLSESYVQEYIKRKATIVGSPFPADVVLEDADGNVVDISSFKGKYLYIDLWASWCGPCCKEVPYLQAIEKDFQDSNIVFLSISTDTDKEAWKNKMAELNMHGNQLHDRNNTLCNSLNVRGIPFFLIYDKEGKLHTYGAMRPSRGDDLKMILEGLE